MKFLFPQFLWALTALSIPVIIHLFNFQRPRKVFFSNVALLESVKTRTASVQNLKHLLVLLSRLLFLLFLVMAFAQPFLPASQKSAALSDQFVKVFYLDNSFSMQQEKDGSTLLENAMSGLEEFAEITGNAEDIYFLDNDFLVKDLFPYSKSNFQDRLSEVNESYSQRTLEEVLSRLEQLEYKGKKEIFLISDLQKSTLGDLSGIQLDSNHIYHLVVLQNSDFSNIYIDSVWLERPFVIEESNNALVVRLQYQGEGTIENFPVQLFLDGRQAAASNVTLATGQSSEVTFSLPEIGDKSVQGKLSIDDSPVFFDNDFYFTLRPVPELLVKVIGPDENKYLKALFQTESFFQYEFMPSGNPDLSALRSADFIICDRLGDYPAFLKDFISDFMRSGGQVLIIPSEKPQALAAFLSESGMPTEYNTGFTALQALADPDLKNPFFKGVFDRFEKNTDMPDATPLLQVRNLGLTHLRFRDGNAFLGEKNIGNGKLYIISGLIDDEKSNFYRHSIFLPVMFKMVSGSIESSSKALFYTFGRRSINWELPDRSLGESAMKLRRDDFEFIPEQRPIPGGFTFDIPSDKTGPGYYQIVHNDSLVGQIALNIDKSESVMDFHDPGELIASIPGGNKIQVDDSGEMAGFAKEYKETHFGTPLWKYFLICSLMFLSAEIFLIRLL